MKVARLFQVLVMTGLAVGCGAKVTVDNGGSAGSGAASGTGGGAATSSCDIRTPGSHVCTTFDLSGDTSGLLAAAELMACEAAKGTPGSCPTASLLGTCTKVESSSTTKESFYSDTSPPLSVAEAAMVCAANGGTFQ